MNTRLALAILLVAAGSLSVDTANATYCGAVSYRLWGRCQGVNYGCSPQCCHTVMKTQRKVVFEKQQQTCYRTCYDTVMQDHTIQCTRMVRKTHCKQIPYTVCRPVYETCTRTQHYTVHRPVWETRTREIPYTVNRKVWETKTRQIPYTTYRTHWETKTRQVPYTVNRTVWETKTRQIPYTTYRTQWETKTRQIPYTVNRTVWETKTREVPYTVNKVVWENRTREIPHTVYRMVTEQRTRQVPYTVYRTITEQRERVVNYTVRRPVHYTKTIQIPSGHWQMVVTQRPGRKIRRVVQSPGTWTWDPCSCRCVYQPGCCRVVCCQGPPRQCCRRVWCPTICTKQIDCVRYVCETRCKTVPYTFCRRVPETCFRTVCS